MKSVQFSASIIIVTGSGYVNLVLNTITASGMLLKIAFIDSAEVSARI